MNETDRLEGKKVLIVDDEPDVLETLADLLSMCEVVTAESFEQGKKILESRTPDLAILDIMGVEGYDLLDVAVKNEVTAVMLTAYALTPEDISRSYAEGAAYFVPKEEMFDIPVFLNDILEAKDKGKSTWDSWIRRMADFCRRKFGPDWKEKDKIKWEKFPFH
jgi:response regulator RpfG family c-di-GMP phosphodiesterase